MKNVLLVTVMIVSIARVGTAFAATTPPQNPGDVAPPCSIAKLAPAYTKSLAANVLGTSAIVATTSYYDWPCYRAVVDFIVAPMSPVPPPHPYEDFFFDSMGNELVDTMEKCQTYRQTTEVYLQQSNGYVLKAQGVLTGTWSTNKCHFHPLSGQNDFRETRFSPAFTQTHWRVVSTVTTGKGIVKGPGYRTYAQAQPFATPRQVCFAIEHMHSNNTPIVGCDDPVP